MQTRAPLLAIVALFVCAIGCISNHSTKTAEISPDLRRAGEARAAAAQCMLDGLEQRYRANEPLTPDFLERLATWSRLLMEARIAISSSRAARITAAEEHLARSRERLDVLERRRDGSHLELEAQRYHVADAEYRLVEIRSES